MGLLAQLALTSHRPSRVARVYSSEFVRMRQFYETYQGDEKVSALLTQLSWTTNLIILSQSKRQEVVEYSLSRTLSPELIAEYQTQLPDKSCCGKSCMSFIYRTRLKQLGRMSFRVTKVTRIVVEWLGRRARSIGN